MNKILLKLLIMDGNETNYINNEETYRLFRDLIIEVAKAEKNIRFCSNNNCPCHPEHTIKILLKNESVVEFLNTWSSGIVEELKSLCQDYSPTVAKEIYGDY